MDSNLPYYTWMEMNFDFYVADLFFSGGNFRLKNKEYTFFLGVFSRRQSFQEVFLLDSKFIKNDKNYPD